MKEKKQRLEIVTQSPIADSVKIQSKAMRSMQDDYRSQCDRLSEMFDRLSVLEEAASDPVNAARLRREMRETASVFSSMVIAAAKVDLLRQATDNTQEKREREIILERIQLIGNWHRPAAN